ncbi:MAG: DUF5666 domain-containing protein, partial [Candidatus Paceibacterota bacterium]
DSGSSFNKGDGNFGIGSFVKSLVQHDDGDRGSKGKDDDRDDDRGKATSTKEHADKSGIVGTVSAISGSTITVTSKDGVTYTVNASGATLAGSEGTSFTLADVKVGDKVNVRGTVSGTTVTATKIVDGRIRARNFLDAIGAVGAGIVSSINGSSFTLSPSVGSSSTTTVSTNASTTYRVNGSATTSNALVVGSRVLVQGTSTSDTSITASLVSIFTNGFGFLKHLFVR